MSGIYLHIPFCRKACSYCDFHFSTHLAGKDQVVKAMIKEMEQRRHYLDSGKIGSIYFGGGTPSLLSAGELEAVFEALHKWFSWDANAEITLEANPDDIHPEILALWKSLGINRLSIGLQSFDDRELAWMNRTHTAEESLYCVKQAQDAGFDNLSIDLIYGSKFQTAASWEKTLKTAVDLNTQHISAYNLTIENKTVLGVQHQKGKEPAVSDELSSSQFLIMQDVLEAAGFTAYEISNYGKAGFFAVHNTNYWLQQPYLGLGPSAHSYNGVSRQWNIKNNGSYIKALQENTPFFEKEQLSTKDSYNEYILTRLRTVWGCSLDEIEEQFGKELRAHFQTRLLTVRAFVSDINDVVTLNREGKLRADGISAELFI